MRHYSRLRSISLKSSCQLNGASYPQVDKDNSYYNSKEQASPQVDKDVTHTTLRSIRIASHSQVDKNDNSTISIASHSQVDKNGQLTKRAKPLSGR
jgi:hypothetical protein